MHSETLVEHDPYSTLPLQRSFKHWERGMSHAQNEIRTLAVHLTILAREICDIERAKKFLLLWHILPSKMNE